MGRKHLVFVSYELYPVNSGGCGVFLWNALQALLETGQFRISVLLDMPKHECDAFIDKHQGALPNVELLTVYCLNDLLKVCSTEISLSDIENIFMFNSLRFYHGLKYLTKVESIDYVEFFDYAGVAFYSVRAKRYQSEFANTVLAVRAHCTIDLMDLEQSNSDLDLERLNMYKMEKISLQECDTVMAPSSAWRELYSERYNITSDKIRVSPPPVHLDGFPRALKISSSPGVIFYGRLFQLKGVDVYVDAAVQYCRKYPNSQVLFYIVGYDGGTSTGGSYRNYLLEHIPFDLQDRFVFTGQLSKDQLGKVLERVQLAVFPNYVESFSYSIHELYHAGIPIICRPIPAFRDYFENGKNCLWFNGTITDLVEKMHCLLTNESFRSRLRFPYPVLNNRRFLESYDFPSIHQRELAKEAEPGSLSIVLLNTDSTPVDSTQITVDELVSRSKSYVLCPYDDQSRKTPMYFLGRRWVVTDLDGRSRDVGSCPLEQYLWIGNVGDRPNSTFFNNALSILSGNEGLHYVASYLRVTKTGKRIVQCLQFELMDAVGHAKTGIRSRAVMRVPQNRTLRDAFDTRLKDQGEWEILSRRGYTVPQVLQDVTHMTHTLNWETIIFAVRNYQYNHNRTNEWVPNDLSALMYLHRSEAQGRRAHVLSNRRRIANGIRNKLSSTKGLPGEIGLKAFNVVTKIIKQCVNVK